MKSALLVLPVFAAIFAAFFSLLTLFTAAYFWIETSEAVGSLGTTVVISHVSRALPQIVILSSILSLFFLLFAFRKRPRIGIPMFIAAAILAATAYGGLFIAVQTMSESSTEEPAVSSPYRAGYIYPIGDYLFYSEELAHRTEDELSLYRPILLISPYTQAPRVSLETHRALSLYRNAALDGAEKSLVLGEAVFAGGVRSEGSGEAGAEATDGEGTAARAGSGGRGRIPLRAGKESLLSSTEPPQLAATLSHEAKMVSANLLALLEKGLPYFAAAILVHVLYVILSWTFIRTSPWPLLNALVGLLLLRLYFFIHRITTGDALRSLMSGLSLEGYGQFLPSGALAALTLLFILWSIAFYAGKKES